MEYHHHRNDINPPATTIAWWKGITLYANDGCFDKMSAIINKCDVLEANVAKIGVSYVGCDGYDFRFHLCVTMPGAHHHFSCNCCRLCPRRLQPETDIQHLSLD